MAGKITDLAAATGATADTDDLLEMVDVSDTSMAATGTNKRMSLSELLAFLHANGMMPAGDPTINYEHQWLALVNPNDYPGAPPEWRAGQLPSARILSDAGSWKLSPTSGQVQGVYMTEATIYSDAPQPNAGAHAGVLLYIGDNTFVPGSNNRRGVAQIWIDNVTGEAFSRAAHYDSATTYNFVWSAWTPLGGGKVFDTSAAGLVPAPGTVAYKFLRDDATWKQMTAFDVSYAGGGEPPLQWTSNVQDAFNDTIAQVAYQYVVNVGDDWDTFTRPGQYTVGPIQAGDCPNMPPVDGEQGLLFVLEGATNQQNERNRRQIWFSNDTQKIHMRSGTTDFEGVPFWDGWTLIDREPIWYWNSPLSYTAMAEDENTTIQSGNPTGMTFTFPPNATTPIPNNAQMKFIQGGTGQITFAAGAGVTLYSAFSGTLKTRTQRSVVYAKKVYTNGWELWGDLEGSTIAVSTDWNIYTAAGNYSWPSGNQFGTNTPPLAANIVNGGVLVVTRGSDNIVVQTWQGWAEAAHTTPVQYQRSAYAGTWTPWLPIGSLDGMLTWKQGVYCATTANITLSGNQTIDGMTTTAGMRVLVKDQTTASQNGIYLASASNWTRATDFDSAFEIAGAVVYVMIGVLNAYQVWSVTNPVSPTGFTLDTTGIYFTQRLPVPPHCAGISNNPYTVGSSDHGKFWGLNNGAAITVNLPANQSIGTEVTFWRDTAATVTFAGVGTTIVSAGNKVTIANRNGVVTVKCLSSTRWLLFGDLA